MTVNELIAKLSAMPLEVREWPVGYVDFEYKEQFVTFVDTRVWTGVPKVYPSGLGKISGLGHIVTLE